MENLFIRVNFSRSATAAWLSSITDLMGEELFLSRSLHSQACTRHIMEIDFVEHVPDNDFSHIIACENLPIFCKTLLAANRACFYENSIALFWEMELRVFIGDEVDSTRDEAAISKTSNLTTPLSAAAKSAAIHHEIPIENLYTATTRDATVRERSHSSRSPGVDAFADTKFRPSEPPILINNSRLLRLLEPF